MSDLLKMLVIGIAVLAYFGWQTLRKPKKPKVTVRYLNEIPPPAHIADPIPKGMVRVRQRAHPGEKWGKPIFIRAYRLLFRG